jgi:hypothetical protein
VKVSIINSCASETIISFSYCYASMGEPKQILEVELLSKMDVSEINVNNIGLEQLRKLIDTVSQEELYIIENDFWGMSVKDSECKRFIEFKPRHATVGPYKFWRSLMTSDLEERFQLGAISDCTKPHWFLIPDLDEDVTFKNILSFMERLSVSDGELMRLREMYLDSSIAGMPFYHKPDIKRRTFEMFGLDPLSEEGVAKYVKRPILVNPILNIEQVGDVKFSEIRNFIEFCYSEETVSLEMSFYY